MRHAVLVLFGIGLASTSVTCSGSSETIGPPAEVAIGSGETVSVARLVAVAGSICQAAKAAPGDSASARTEFERSHPDLHLLARAVTRLDRGIAARLLLAKRAVEEDLAGDVVGLKPDKAGGGLTSDLRRLSQAALASLARLGAAVSECPAPT